MYEGKNSRCRGILEISCKFDFGDNFQEDLAYVEKGMKQSFINKQGKVVLKHSSKRNIAGSFSCGLVPFKGEKGEGYLNKQGKVIVKPVLYSTRNFITNRAIVSIDENKYGIIESTCQYNNLKYPVRMTLL